MFPTPTAIAYDNGPSNLDRRHIAFVNFIYEIPFLKNSSNRLLKSTVGGWQVSGVVSLQSGNPMNITEGGITNCAAVPTPSSCTGSPVGTANITSVLPNSSNRPNVDGSVGTPHSVSSWFDASAFSPTAAGEFGNMPRNSVYGPGRQNWNIASSRALYSANRAEAGSNYVRKPSTLSTTRSSKTSATPSPTSNFGAVTTAHDPREIELGVKLIF